MANIYYDTDADLDILKDRTIAFIGYGNQGRSQALNLRDSGIPKIIIGNVEDDYARQAREDGFEVTSIPDAAGRGDILFMLIPDEYAPKVYTEEIEPHLKDGDILNFSSGYNITFGNIVPPDFVDIIMIAPRMVGMGVREMYESGEGYPSFVSWHKDHSGKAKEYTLAIAKAIGSTKKGAVEVTFADETYLDLLAEQGTWPLVMAVFDEVFKFEVEMGHPEEAALIELYMSKEPVFIFEKMVESGIFSQLKLHSHTSQYGQLSGLVDVERHFIKNFLREKYRKIKSGEFAREWEAEKDSDLAELKRLFSKAVDSEIGKAEARVRDRLSQKDYSTYEDMVKKITEEVLKKLKDNS